jgi:formate dehydrogenase assembly factor FdhD
MSLKPLITQSHESLTRTVQVCNEFGERSETAIPAERALVIYLDKKELVTLMTLGAEPEHLVLGFLRNQRLIDSVEQIESITVDWTIGEGETGEPGVAAVKTRAGVQLPVPPSAERVVTTGCGQGSVFGDLMASHRASCTGWSMPSACRKPPTNRLARCTAAPCFRAITCSSLSKTWVVTTQWTPSRAGCG